jgi:hypothetical protein
MKNKILCILAFTLLISIFAVPSMATEISIIIEQPNSDFIPIPGHIEGEIPILKAKYKVDILPPELETVSYNDDLLSLIEPLDENMYLGYLENITAFGPRVTTTQGCVDAGDYIYNQFVSMGLDAEYFYWEDGSLWGNNIIGILEGNDQTSDEIYIICGHYDTVSGTVGADDNGAGTAAVLAAAYLMRNAEFDHTIKFIGFSGEEQGLYGSYYYAKEAAQNGDNIKAVLNLDMIGYTESTSDGKKLKVFDDEDESVWITDFIDSIAVEYIDNFDLDIIHAGYTWGSDHYYFWEYGYHAIFGHEYKFSPHWHQPSDIIENMNISYATRVTQLMIVSLAELSGFITYNAPYIPDIPDGPINGKVGEEYTYSTTTTDPQGDEIFYLFDWGDGTDSGWLGPYESGDTVSASHNWSSKDTFKVKAKAKDSNGYESEFSDFISVIIPRNKIKFTIMSILLERICKIFPIISRLLQ